MPSLNHLRALAGRVLRRAGQLTEHGTRPRLPDLVDLSRRGPLISVVMPVYEPDEAHLRAALASVSAQVYTHWELCIADDASPSAYVKSLLEEFCAKEPRARVIFREINGHISAASNTAVGMARGTWVALLDHDDVLAPLALAHAAVAIEEHPGAALLYSDEDKVDHDGSRHGAYRKPAWNPELALSHNFVSHLGVFRLDVLCAVGGFREGFEGSQDHDLMLRVAERVLPEQIVHIPYVLYHWRVSETSTAGATEAKPYAVEAGRRAVLEHCARTGLDAAVEHVAGVGLRVRPRGLTPAGSAGLTVVRLPPEAAVSGLDLMRGLDCAEEDDVVFLSSTAGVPDDECWARELRFHLGRPGVGAVGGRLLDQRGMVREGAMVITAGRRDQVATGLWTDLPTQHGGPNSRALLQQRVSALSGHFLAVRRSCLAGVTPDARLHTYADVDLAMQLAGVGLGCLLLPEATLLDRRAGEPRRDAHETSLLRRRHPALRAVDPFYPKAFRPPPRFEPKRLDDELGVRELRAALTRPNGLPARVDGNTEAH